MHCLYQTHISLNIMRSKCARIMGFISNLCLFTFYNCVYKEYTRGIVDIFGAQKLNILILNAQVDGYLIPIVLGKKLVQESIH